VSGTAQQPKKSFRFRLIVEEEYQPVSVVPIGLWLFMAMMLAAQVALGGKIVEQPVAKAEELSAPPSAEFLIGASFGSQLALSRVLMLRLQAFDNQPGISLPYADLDYDKIRKWLEVILEMNPTSAYPLLSAARVYSGVRDPAKKRVMFDFVHEAFLKDPNLRWEWLSHVAVLTNEVLKDSDLALKYSRDLRELTDPQIVPNWARQMEIFYREANSEYEVSILLIEQLLESGEVSDQHEFTFLFDRLSDLIEKAWRSGQIRSEAELDEKLARLDSLRERFLELEGIEGAI